MPRLSATVAFSLMPMLKKTGVTLNDSVCREDGTSGSNEYMASGTGSITVRAVRDPTTRGNGICEATVVPLLS